ncbi:peroxiredoxin family protein [Cerasicoccus arenae]|uniref:Thioredoxin domain-containing protein n=1 Tax=Cerasicoccus arenae TaxID=424488 RepID=A0A8J3DFM7_9BACT|nr:TlpA disulfide reductase family protein [Cerasicoccus arenae]MBK1859445.1 redoxin domain-containing protein [Cerasicoccus arenae]GHB94177.1 hypothetical protein GCM10007047_07300 [Cerasicoccus arenae]
MNAPHSCRTFLLVALLTIITLGADGRTYQMRNGDVINGEVVSFKNGMIVLAKDGGGKSLVTLDAFSDADQAYLQEKFPQGDKREAVRATTSRSTIKPTPTAKPQTAAPTQQKAAPAQSNHPGLKTLRQGALPPAIKARIQGKSDYVSVSDLKGKIVVVHFWSTGTPPSIEEVKGLAYLYEKYHGRGFELIGVAMDNSQRRLNDAEEALGITWPMRLDEERRTIEEWGVTALPTNVLIDQVGVIRQEHISANDLQYVLAEQLGPVK